jgi:uroporphyrinogen-III synthase
LHDRGIVVTRPRGLAGNLARLIEGAGGRALLFPAIEIVAATNIAPVTLSPGDIAVFVSPSAVHMALPRLAQLPDGVRIAAIGAGTRRELEHRGVQRVLAPGTGADSEALLALPELQSLPGARVVIFRGEGGRSLLGDTLAERGARVEYVECYRRQRPLADARPLIDDWRRGRVHALTVSSAQALTNLLDMLGAELLATLPIFVPHVRVAQHGHDLGLRAMLVAGPGDEEMLAHLMAYFAPHER